MKIARVEDPQGQQHEAYSIVSDSGHTYVVRYEGCPDADGIANLWSCTCPAGQHGRDCKHLRAVLAATLDEYGDPIEYEVGETVA
ncbi:MAG: SWIM zinc finger family protein [Candidatus Paceibacterota bacterium]|jgi:hypothetical protein